MSLITSRTNPKIKQVRLLRQRKHRMAQGLFIVEGIHHVGEACAAAEASRVQIDSIFYAPELLKSPFASQLVREMGSKRIAVYQTSEDVFASIADKENPQGMLALVRYPRFDLVDYSALNLPWGVALHAPQDPGNVGSIMRSIDAAGASGLILLDSSVDPYHPGSVRASMGSVFWHPILMTSFQEFARWVKDHGYTMYGTSANASVDYRAVMRYESPMILFMGSEREGLSVEHRAACQQILRLPMSGRVSSLNLSAATSIMLYHMLERGSIT